MHLLRLRGQKKQILPKFHRYHLRTHLVDFCDFFQAKIHQVFIWNLVRTFGPKDDLPSSSCSNRNSFWFSIFSRFFLLGIGLPEMEHRILVLEWVLGDLLACTWRKSDGWGESHFHHGRCLSSFSP